MSRHQAYGPPPIIDDAAKASAQTRGQEGALSVSEAFGVGGESSGAQRVQLQ